MLYGLDDDISEFNSSADYAAEYAAEFFLGDSSIFSTLSAFPELDVAYAKGNYKVLQFKIRIK